MNNRIFLLGGGALVLVIFAIVQVLLFRSSPITPTHITINTPPATTTETASAPLPDRKSNLQLEVFVDANGNPLEGSVISSPLSLSGRARGTWYFEASFPIELRDNTGKTLSIAIAQAQSDWMTEDFVDWVATMEWSATSTTATSGVLIFKRDNPSGLPEHDKSLEIPVFLQ